MYCQAYSVTKAAQIHLVKGLANAAGPNIRVNSVSPGLMLTVRISQRYIPRTKNVLLTVVGRIGDSLCFLRKDGRRYG